MATEWKCYKQTFKDTWIRSLKSTINLLITDTVTPGLHLRFYANTKNIVFYLGYMVKGTRQHRNIKIGNWGDLKTETVREQAAAFRKQVTNGFDPMEERQKEIKKTLAEQRQRVKTSVLLEEYFEKVSKTRKRASTQKSDRGQIDRYLNPMLGNMWITDLELPIIIDFYDKMVAKTSFSTATRALQLVSAFWNWCELKGYKVMNSNPCSKVDKRRNEKKKHKRLTIEEYKRLLDAMDAGLTESPYNPRMFRALKVLMFTGCRVTEITGLKKSEINFETRFIEFENPNKNDEDGHPLPIQAIEELKIAIAESPKDSIRVFPATRGTDESLLDIRKAFAWAVERAGLPRMERHDFRRSFITVGTDTLNIPIQTVSSAIGHANVSTTEIYSRISDKTRLKTADEIATAIAG